MLKMIEMSRGTIPIAQRAPNINSICVASTCHTLLGASDVGMLTFKLAGDVGMLTFKIHVEPLFHSRSWGAQEAVGWQTVGDFDCSIWQKGVTN